MFVLEWFARLARAHCPGLHLAQLSQVRVLSGLVADRYFSGGDLDLVATVRTSEATAAGRSIALELHDAPSGRLHYRCNADLVVEPPRPLAPVDPPVSAPGETWTDEIYFGDVLFHGPAFRVIEDITTVSAHGLEAELWGVRAVGWPSEPWVTDPALLDGALQLALLWTGRLLGGGSLPTAIDRVQIFEAPGLGRHTATLVGRRATSNMVVCDISIRSSTGATVALLEGVETHKLQRST